MDNRSTKGGGGAIIVIIIDARAIGVLIIEVEWFSLIKIIFYFRTKFIWTNYASKERNVDIQIPDYLELSSKHTGNLRNMSV